MKRIASLLLCLILIILLAPSVFAVDSGLLNFQKIFEYTPGKFSDVKSDSWYAENVKVAYELGLVQGNSETTFNSTGNITLAETLALACRLHRIYNTGKTDFEQGVPWYQVYVDYAIANCIIDTNELSNYNSTATRSQFASILAACIPKSALTEINTVDDDAIPDVAITAQHSNEIYMLYRAGILTGNDKAGTFTPNSNIQRSAVATIVTRMADESMRQFFMLTKTAINNYLQINSNTGAYKILNEDEYLLITANFDSKIVANKNIAWSSSDYNIATVSNGLVCGKNVGRAEITASYNGTSATCIVLVASNDGFPEYVGKMALKKDDILYKSGLPKNMWVEKAKYFDGANDYNVYTINGQYYISNLLLENLAACYYGDEITVYSNNPYIKDPQLIGTADLRYREEAHTDYVSETVKILTRTIYITLPSKKTVSFDLASFISIKGPSGTTQKSVFYNSNEVFSDYYNQSVPYFLDVMGIDCNWYFDSNTKQLIFEID